MNRLKLFPILFFAVITGGCAIQTPPVEQKEPPQSLQNQKDAQKALKEQTPTKPTLKRKIALGRVTNETVYGRSLLRDEFNDPLGKQVTDMMSKVLTESGAYLVFERPDIARVKNDVAMSGNKLNLIGVDTLIVGSLTEFGRKTVGESGFVSQSKRQVAFAKVDIRLVDTKTGQVYFAASGAGEASNEVASTFGFGSRADYDGTLNDAAMRQAITDAVAKISAVVDKQPWSTYILKAEGSRIFIGGGKSQGIKEGMVFNVETAGEKIKSPQTGAEITLPGQTIASIRVISLFGEGELNEGSLATVVNGTLGGRKITDLVVRYDGVLKWKKYLIIFLVFLSPLSFLLVVFSGQQKSKAFQICVQEYLSKLKILIYWMAELFLMDWIWGRLKIIKKVLHWWEYSLDLTD